MARYVYLCKMYIFCYYNSILTSSLQTYLSLLKKLSLITIYIYFDVCYFSYNCMNVREEHIEAYIQYFSKNFKKSARYFFGTAMFKCQTSCFSNISHTSVVVEHRYEKKKKRKQPDDGILVSQVKAIFYKNNIILI